MSAQVIVDDCRTAMNALPEASVDALVTDPPYELGFMGKKWDKSGVSFDVATWQAAYRVVKPGGFLLAFGGTRTFHRIACAIEDAGFEIRDSLAWLYATGFPKSHDVSKAIDREAGAKREVLGTRNAGRASGGTNFDDDAYVWPGTVDVTAPATDLAKQWEGWGTALKPAFEPIIVARKPLIGTVAKNVEVFGTGGININSCRIDYESDADKASATPQGRATSKESAAIGAEPDAGRKLDRVEFERGELKGRWPANVVLDEYMTDVLGDRARFFFCAKASKSERNKGMPSGVVNTHPTVKPVEVMRWLVRLVTPPNGVVLDPFVGSGTTGVAALEEGFDFIGIDLGQEAATIANHRLGHATEYGLMKEFPVAAVSHRLSA